MAVNRVGNKAWYHVYAMLLMSPSSDIYITFRSHDLADICYRCERQRSGFAPFVTQKLGYPSVRTPHTPKTE